MKRRSFIASCIGAAAACVGVKPSIGAKPVEKLPGTVTINEFRRQVLRIEPIPHGDTSYVNDADDLRRHITSEYAKALTKYLDETMLACTP